MFKTWVANELNARRVDRTYDGAALKYLRKKRGLRLNDVASAAGLIENGHKIPTLEEGAVERRGREGITDSTLPPTYDGL